MLQQKGMHLKCYPHVKCLRWIIFHIILKSLWIISFRNHPDSSVMVSFFQKYSSTGKQSFPPLYSFQLLSLHSVRDHTSQSFLKIPDSSDPRLLHFPEHLPDSSPPTDFLPSMHSHLLLNLPFLSIYHLPEYNPPLQ